ncbi:MAG: hypothetical protein HKP24_01940, partial [Croceitalea sp.]|nr:hypothetical protein [Croceitalea sp.]
PVAADAFVGAYTLSQIDPSIFGVPTWGEGTEVTLSIGETSTQRTFAAVYLPAFGIGQDPADFVFDLVCESVEVPNSQGSGLQCSSGITLGSPRNGVKGTYDPFDDSSFTIYFRDDESDDCGGGVDASVRLTKV